MKEEKKKVYCKNHTVPIEVREYEVEEKDGFVHRWYMCPVCRITHLKR